MRTCPPFTSIVVTVMLVTGLCAFVGLSGATSLGGDGPTPEGSPGQSPKVEIMTKQQIVKKYVDGCRGKSVKEANCDKLRKDAVEIVKEDLHTLGSSADRVYIPAILKIFKSDETVLRIAAADAIGMIGPQDSDSDLLAPLANDPVPDVRKAVWQMISRGKGSAITLLGQRTMSMRTGLTPEKPPDPAKFTMPVAPGSTFLFYGSDTAVGRLSYVAKGMTEASAFFKGKAKKGPYKLDEFQEKYRYQLQDEEQARDQAQEEKAKQFENVKPDPTNMKSFTEYLEKVQSVQAGQTTMMLLDSYQPNLFGAPTVYVLEERQIGQRSYPTRYVILYQDQALKRPGYRLSWMTVTDDAVKAAQVASIVNEKQEEAQNKQSEAMKKREEALQDMVKKKDEQEKKKFKKGQSDLEKELGF
ncbi:MAG: HEAT repeat domain-containing protein [Nitrospiraceae bacterium]